MTHVDIMAQAKALAGDLHKQSRATDENGLGAEAVAQMAAAGLFTAAQPDEVMERARQIALGCGASAWLVSGLAAGASVVKASGLSGLEGPVLHIGDLETAELCGTETDPCLSGALGFVGGLDHADWVLISGLRRSDQRVYGLVRRSDLTVRPLEYRGGLRGMNWSAISLDQAPVRLFSLPEDVAYHWSEAVILVGAVLGVAQGGYDDYVATTRARITGIGGQAVAQFTQVQARLAESHAELKTLTTLYEAVLQRVRDGQAGHPECMRDRVYIARKSVEAVNRLLSQMGAMGLSETNPVQRRYRDLKALACVRGLDWVEQMPAFGKYELGLMDAVP